MTRDVVDVVLVCSGKAYTVDSIVMGRNYT